MDMVEEEECRGEDQGEEYGLGEIFWSLRGCFVESENKKGDFRGGLLV
jgi:hypothetical protein